MSISTDAVFAITGKIDDLRESIQSSMGHLSTKVGDLEVRIAVIETQLKNDNEVAKSYTDNVIQKHVLSCKPDKKDSKSPGAFTLGITVPKWAFPLLLTLAGSIGGILTTGVRSCTGTIDEAAKKHVGETVNNGRISNKQSIEIQNKKTEPDTKDQE